MNPRCANEASAVLMPNEVTLTALLLAGGESRRMGFDKATLMLGGEALWARQLRLLQALHPARICISARAGVTWCPSGVKVILDEPPSRGPLSGLAGALACLETSHLLALAIDLPQMTAAHLQQLLALAQPGRGVVPINEQLFEPLCAVYPSEALGAAKHALYHNQLSLQSLVKVLLESDRLILHPISESDQGLYLNLNSPTAYGAVRRTLG